MSESSYREALTYFTGLLPDLLEREREVGVRPVMALDAATQLVPPLRAQGRPAEEVLAALEQLARNVPLTTTPAFFNQLFSGRDAIATVADMLASHLNNSLYTYKAAGPLVLAENQVLEHMLGFAGFPGGEGTFTPGGSLSNMLALALARNEVLAKGAGSKPLAIYTSDQNHYSIPKGAVFLGLGHDSVRKIATDEEGRMRVDELRRVLEADLAAGVVPMMINATAQTTVMGAFDPLAEIADVAEAHGIWLHVDGAWGGSLLFVERYRRQHFAGLSRCDSLTWDAHKLMGVPLTCSVLLLREKGYLERHLGPDAEYLFQTHSPELNPGLRSLQCGRRNDVLKLWAAWQHHGDEGYAARFETLLARRDDFVAMIRAEPRLSMCHEPQGLNVCFEMPGVDPRQLCSELNERGLAVVGHARVNGRDTVRAIVANPEQTVAVLERFVADLLMVGESIRTK